MSWKGWLALTFALPVLYLLSVPPLLVTNGAGKTCMFPPLYHSELMWNCYGDPYFWLRDHTVLSGLMDRYYLWWVLDAFPQLRN